MEIIWELTQIKENSMFISKNILTQGKRVEAQRAQSTVISSITELMEFDKIKVPKNT